MGGIFLLLALLFAAFFLLNVYFRVKVLKSYSSLSRDNVKFPASDVFSKSKIEEVVVRYPEHAQDIRNFARHMRYSMWMASVFIVLIIILGYLLLNNRASG